MCYLATPRCDLDQPGWICRLIHFVEAQWLSGRMPASRSREHRHESSTHICAVDDDSLWRCYATTKYNHCTIVLVHCNKLWFILFIYNTVAPLKLLNDFHRKLIYLCKIYDSPLGIVGMIVSMKNMGPFAHTNTNLKCHLSSTPKVKVWIFAFVLFQKVDIWSRNVPIVKSVTSSSFSVVVSKRAWYHRRVLEESSLSKGKSKGRLYIAQRFTLFALPVYSDTNSASPGSTLTMQRLRVTTKSLTFLQLPIGCCRNSCHIAWIVILWARVPFALAHI